MTHIPVLLDEVLHHVIPDAQNPPQRAIDGTLGAGGHTRALLDSGVEEILAFDLDLQAIRLAKDGLSDYTDRVQIVQGSYVQMAEAAQQRGWSWVDAIILDLGLSSMQLDTAERGFAFQYDAPLDMRFDNQSGRLTAADLVNNLTAEELADIFFRYGEERFSRKIAQAIVHTRPITTTRELAAVAAAAVPRKQQGKMHPATRIFQALRIAVNEELHSVETVLPLAIDLLRSGGRLAVISFHSLEDRIVKKAFKQASTEIITPPGMASIESKQAIVREISRKPITPSAVEIENNPRSRSSKLRVVEKI